MGQTDRDGLRLYGQGMSTTVRSHGGKEVEFMDRQ